MYNNVQILIRIFYFILSKKDTEIFDSSCSLENTSKSLLSIVNTVTILIDIYLPR